MSECVITFPNETVFKDSCDLSIVDYLFTLLFHLLCL